MALKKINFQRVWVLKESAPNFEEMRLKYSRPTGRTSPTGSMTSRTSTASTDEDPLVEDLLRVGNFSFNCLELDAYFGIK